MVKWYMYKPVADTNEPGKIALKFNHSNSNRVSYVAYIKV